MLIDAVGNVHAALAAGAQPRIVSLVPSITELLCDLGLAQHVVGRTGFCIHPAELVRAMPKVGGTKDVNLEKIRALAPSHLIVNIDENEKPVVEALAAFIPHLIVTHPQTPRDNLALYRLLGGIFGAESQADCLCRAFEHAYAALAARPRKTPRTVLYCIWQDPWMTVSKDTYIANMLAEIGWQTWQSPKPERYPAFDWSPAVIGAIDMVLLSTEPYRFTAAHVDALERQIGVPVQLVDGEMLSWYGSRAIAGLRYLDALAGL
ncbi:helical backbone metal receptor [Herminiimonas sp. CN]|uniref:helical backbone metal receptor n=1 Tax=Herminiimonas sp. CN TaxID=1349818 RepID=UPI0004734E86|nr:helical backbone metal receptor [Herminiimonas sp. CN]